MTYDVVFVVASALAIVSALGVVLSSNPFHSALSLIGNLVALAAMYLLLQSDFLAAAQVIVYAGAVMIMFLFVIAYLGGRANEPVRSRPWWQTGAALIAAIAVVAEIGFAVDQQAFGDGAHVSDLFGAPQAIAGSFHGRYVLAFEATSVLLLIAAVVSVIDDRGNATYRNIVSLGKKRLDLGIVIERTVRVVEHFLVVAKQWWNPVRIATINRPR